MHVYNGKGNYYLHQLCPTAQKVFLIVIKTFYPLNHRNLQHITNSCIQMQRILQKRVRCQVQGLWRSELVCGGSSKIAKRPCVCQKAVCLCVSEGRVFVLVRKPCVYVCACMSVHLFESKQVRWLNEMISSFSLGFSRAWLRAHIQTMFTMHKRIAKSKYWTSYPGKVSWGRSTSSDYWHNFNNRSRAFS